MASCSSMWQRACHESAARRMRNIVRPFALNIRFTAFRTNKYFATHADDGERREQEPQSASRRATIKKETAEMYSRNSPVLLIAVSLLAACGGGGSGGNSEMMPIQFTSFS